KERAPRGSTRFMRDLGVTLDGQELSSGIPPSPLAQAGAAREREAQNPKYQDGDAHGWDPGSQVRAMDQEGIDVAVLFPSRGLFPGGGGGQGPARAACSGPALYRLVV